MTRQHKTASVKMAFEAEGQRIAIADIQPLKLVSEAVKKTPKYAQIATSMHELGIIEPPVVARDQTHPGKYLLLDGHSRIEVLRDMGQTEVTCLLKAVERGVPEDRIAKALNVDVASIVRKRKLLEGICPEVAEILKDKHIAIATFSELKKMVPLRQIEAAELMVAMNNYTVSYGKSLLAATPPIQLVDPSKPKRIRGLSEDQVALMERESVNLEREFKLAEKSYGSDHLDLVLSNGYIGKLLTNARVVKYLAQHNSDILTEFQKLARTEAAAA
jgi:hypothetical protein